MIESVTIQEFLDVLSSKEPVPGEGGASVLTGAPGNALGQMVSNPTVGKKKYALVEDEIKELAERTKGIQGQFTQLADQDAKASALLAKCYGLPSGMEEEKAYKAKVMEVRLLDASLVPMEAMEKVAEMLEIMDIFADKGNRIAVSDAGVGAQFVRTALLGAVTDVYINTKSMKNREKAEEMSEKMEHFIREGTEAADRIYQKVLGQLRQKPGTAGFHEPADVYLSTPTLQNRQQDDGCLQEAPYAGGFNPGGKGLEQGSGRAEHDPVKFTVRNHMAESLKASGRQFCYEKGRQDNGKIQEDPSPG